jgi:hypothetical protein
LGVTDPDHEWREALTEATLYLLALAAAVAPTHARHADLFRLGERLSRARDAGRAERARETAEAGR